MSKFYFWVLALGFLSSNSYCQDTAINLCQGENASIVASVTGIGLHWEVDKGNGFEAVVNSSLYSGATSNTLQITNAPTSINGFNFRCVTSTANSEITAINFTNQWIGGYSPFWEDSLNWSCGRLPDVNSYVVIATANIVASSNIAVRSLEVKSGSKLTVQKGFSVTISGKLIPGNDFNLTSEEINILDKIGVPTPTLAEITPYLYSGPRFRQSSVAETVPLDRKAIIISDMLSNARSLSDDYATIFPAEPNEVTKAGKTLLKPAHPGYAYSYGNKLYTDRDTATMGEDLHMEYSVFGIDCSGFVMRLFELAGLSVTRDLRLNTNVASFQKKISAALEKQYKSLTLRKIKRTDPGFVLQNGDILYKSGHIGWYYNVVEKGELIFQSNGNPDPTSKRLEGRDAKAEQLWNLNLNKLGVPEKEPHRGVHPVGLESPEAKVLFKNYQVLRLIKLPEVETVDNAGKKGFGLNELTDSTASVSGLVKQEGETKIISRGVCYSSNLNSPPTVFDLKTSDSAGLGSFTAHLKKLMSGSKYAARAYAINETDTAYGNTIVFNTNGIIDTVETLIAHGTWRAYFYGKDAQINKLGVLESQKEAGPPCEDLVTGYSRTDSVSFRFADKVNGVESELQFERYSAYTHEPCETMDPVSEYGWHTIAFTWEYIRETGTMRWYFESDDYEYGDLYFEFKINTFSSSEMSLHWNTVYLGQAQDNGLIKLN